jgi:hypothetical protein
MNQSRSQQETRFVCCVSPPGYRLGALFNHEDEASMFFQNVDKILPDYVELHLKRQYSSVITLRTSNPTTFWKFVQFKSEKSICCHCFVIDMKELHIH